MTELEQKQEFIKLLSEYRYDFCKLVYLIFPFGQKGHPLEKWRPYDWQMKEWARLSAHLQNPATRYRTYRLIISSGNGAAKTAFGAMTVLMLMYTQKVKGRITANTDPQMKTIVWPEYDLWFQRARYFSEFFEKFGTSIKAKDPKESETWRFDTVTWSEQSPQAMSGLHNKGGCALYVFEEAPGIPSVIWKYAAGAFTETETIKIHMAFGNSDDPESQFEQNMDSKLWRSVRIDTRTLPHISAQQIEDWLYDAGGDEDNDDFRVRVRGLPRKTAADAIIRKEDIEAALKRAEGFDKESVKMLPCVLSCDPAWTGGDETTIWYSQGNYRCLLEVYKLDKINKETHDLTYRKLIRWEKALGADAWFVDQGEGTSIATLASNDGRTNVYLIAFNQQPNDTPDPKDSEYSNIRAQMYYETGKFLREGGVLDTMNPEWKEKIVKQLSTTKGGRHQITQKKKAEPKVDIKKRTGSSPDVADGCVLLGAIKILDRLPENETTGNDHDRFTVGQGAYHIVDRTDVYDETSFMRGTHGLYD